ncbi:thioredoxin family protein [bacterium]|nr:thioredoxin family protein [bacterium]MBU1984198.1 thioredoxin family protein [bacterium]
MGAGDPKAQGLIIGSPMPPFNLKNVDGSMLASETFSGKRAVAVIFSCNHCPFVHSYESRMIQLAGEYQPKGVPFVLINPNDPKKQPQDSFENMQKRAAEKGYPFPYLLDETQNVAKAYGASRTPEVFLFGPDRKLVYWGRIDDNTEEPQVKKRDLKDALDHVLAGTPAAIEEPITKAFGCTIKWRD